jgi:hypothetical protein
MSRATGKKYSLDIEGHRIDCVSLKDLLARGLTAFEKYKPGTLDRLSRIKLRTKRIVARDRDQLFDQAKLSDKYSERLSEYAEHLSEVWWFGTNNSRAETEAWLKRGCKEAGLQWGKGVIATL